MRYAVVAMLTVVALMLPAAASYAKEEYYIEVGADEKQDAGDQWKTLVKNHKELLGKLKYYPKQVMDDGKVIATRIQAGPIASKGRAQKTCAALFEKKIPCFVIEGMNDAPPPSSVVSLSDKMSEGRTQKVVSLPWLASEAPPAPAPETSSSWIPDMPWDGDDKPAKEKTVAAKPAEEKPAAVSPSAGKVDVAEAIRVPLTEESISPPPAAIIHDQPVTVASLPEEKIYHHEELEPAVQSQEGSGWISVESFDDEDSATRFWQKVRKKSKADTSNLRVRIDRSLLRRGSSAVLNIGPFAGQYEGDTFCHDAVWELDNSLHCSFTDKPGAAVAAADSAPMPASRGDAYNERRKQFRDQRHSINAPSEPVMLKSSKLYWLQVLTAPSEMEALKQWEQVRTDNSDLLEGMRSSVSASFTDKTSYVVRVGPVTDNDKAISLCDKLHERGVNCRVLLFSASR